MQAEIRPKSSRDARASLWYIASNLISRGSSFIFTPIFTRALTPEEYGVYPMYLSFMGIFTVITTLELGTSTLYKGIDRFEENGGNGFISSVFGLECALFAVAFTLYSILERRVNALTGLGRLATVALLFQIFFNTVEGLYFANKRYFGNYRPITILNATSGALAPMLALVLIKFGFRGEARIIAPLAISAVAAAFIIPGLINKKELFSPKKWKYALKISLPMLPNYFSASLIAQGDKLIVGRVIGKEALGKYSAAFSVGFVPSVVTSGITLALTPWILRKLKENRFERIVELNKSALTIIGILIMAYLTAIPEAFAFFAPSEYKSALPVCYFVAVSVLFSLLYSFASAILLFYEKTLTITKNSIIAATVALLVGYPLTVKFGYIGAAIGTLCAHLLLFILGSISVRRVSGKSLVNTKQYLPRVAAIAAFTILSFALYGSIFARILLFSAAALAFAPSLTECKKALF